MECATKNPQWARTIVLLTACYLHLGPFSRHVIGQIEQQLDGSQDIEQVRNTSVELSNVVVSTGPTMIARDPPAKNAASSLRSPRLIA
jgi:hypothetical protein